MAAQPIRIQGLRDLQRAFALADKMLSRELTGRLREAAEPVRGSAESRAETRIRNIGIPWSRMRVGVTRVGVYVAPRKRGRATARSRPNLAGLLLVRAMQPALEANQSRVVDEVENLLGEVGRAWERV